MLPKTSNSLQNGLTNQIDSAAYAAIIATALKKELGGSHRAIKTIQRWTGAGERTAINWLSAENGPSGPYLATLSMHSDAVLEAFLIMAQREHIILDLQIEQIRHELEAALSKIDDLLQYGAQKRG
jgi:hypothetical protein